MPWQWRAHGTVKTQLPSQSDLILSVLTSRVSVNSATPRKMSFSSSVSTYIHEPIAWTHHWPGGLQDHLLHFYWLVFPPVVAAVTGYRAKSGTVRRFFAGNLCLQDCDGGRLGLCLTVWPETDGFFQPAAKDLDHVWSSFGPALLASQAAGWRQCRCPHYLHHWSDWLVVRLTRRITSQLSLRWRCPSKGDSKLSYQDWNALPAPGSFFRCKNRKQPCGVTSWLFCNWRALSLV